MPPFSDSRVCAEMETMRELNINVWLVALQSILFIGVFWDSDRIFIDPLSVYLKMVVAVLQMRAKGGQQLDSEGSNVLHASLLQVWEPYRLITPPLQEEKSSENKYLPHQQMFGGFCTLRKGAFLAGPAVRRKSSLRSMSSSRKTSSAGPRRTSTRTLNMWENS